MGNFFISQKITEQNNPQCLEVDFGQKMGKTFNLIWTHSHNLCFDAREVRNEKWCLKKQLKIFYDR